VFDLGVWGATAPPQATAMTTTTAKPVRTCAESYTARNGVRRTRPRRAKCTAVNRGYGANKRQREDLRQRKQADKARRRLEKRENGPGEVPIEQGGVTDASPSIDEIMKTLDGKTREQRAAPAIPARLFVGGLAPEMTEQVLRGAFEKIGPVSDAFVMRDRDSGQPRGFGFVTMQDRKDAARAISELHGTELLGGRLVVNVATERGR
jgi:hypothetical protein